MLSAQVLSQVQLSVIPWMIACQAALFMEFSRQEYWSGLLCPTSGHLPDLRIEPASLASPAMAGRFFTTLPPGKPKNYHVIQQFYSQVNTPKSSIIEKEISGFRDSQCLHKRSVKGSPR